MDWVWTSGVTRLCPHPSVVLGPRRWIVRSSLFGWHDPALIKCRRLRRCSDGRLAMVDRSPQLRDRAGSLDVLDLSGYWGDMSRMRGSLFFACRTFVDPAITAV